MMSSKYIKVSRMAILLSGPLLLNVIADRAGVGYSEYWMNLIDRYFGDDSTILPYAYANSKDNTNALFSQLSRALQLGYGANLEERVKEDGFKVDELVALIFANGIKERLYECPEVVKGVLLGENITSRGYEADKATSFAEAMAHNVLDCDTAAIPYAGIGCSIGYESFIRVYDTHALCVWRMGDKPFYIECTNGTLYKDFNHKDFEEKHGTYVGEFKFGDRKQMLALSHFTLAVQVKQATMDVDAKKKLMKQHLYFATKLCPDNAYFKIHLESVK
jgi:hypothetical protein